MNVLPDNQDDPAERDYEFLSISEGILVIGGMGRTRAKQDRQNMKYEIMRAKRSIADFGRTHTSARTQKQTTK